MNASPIQETLRYVVIGGIAEAIRPVLSFIWRRLLNSLFLTAQFSQDDFSYDWIVHWLSKQPAWGHSKRFDITTRFSGLMGLTTSTTGDLDDDEEALIHGRRRFRLALTPSVGTTHTIYYRGYWLRILRTRSSSESASALTISVIARSNDIFKKLVLEAKRGYEKDAEHRVHVFIADTLPPHWFHRGPQIQFLPFPFYHSHYMLIDVCSRTSSPCWQWNGARKKRPMSSIVLQADVKDKLLADCKDFLQSEEWYAERGIPFRRGYLLHGVPGSGKTSLIHSLAGELDVDIYVLSLSIKGMSDNTLTTLMGRVPSRCILLLEDLDVAFTRGVSRDEKSTGAPTAATSEEKDKAKAEAADEALSRLVDC
ncbi:hypothetical protein BDZ89DRAFT_404399 [Hymenopellis radicata]|nr:hypothetical protein BDZ89DRAFT_404399 [Hymenopellis radicata]